MRPKGRACPDFRDFFVFVVFHALLKEVKSFPPWHDRQPGEILRVGKCPNIRIVDRRKSLKP